MGDVDEGRAEFVLELFQLDLHVLAQLQIEGPQRLVQQEHVGIEDEAAGYGHALFLAAGKLRDLLASRTGKADPF